MELSGEEKKLQALFSDLKAADEEAAPRFAGVWNRAQPGFRYARAFNRALAGVAALVLCAVAALALWSRYSSRPIPPVSKLAVAPAPGTVDHAPTTAPKSTAGPNLIVETQRVKPATSHRNSIAKRFTARHQTQLLAADRITKQDAKTIANWKSPTTALLSSPSDEIFSSLPQVNQNSTELKTFLLTRSN